MSLVSRECVSISGASGGISALVVSCDEERESFLSELIVYKDFAADQKVVLSKNIWLSQMWKSAGGRHFMCEVLGSVHWQTKTKFQQKKLSDDQLFCIWGLDDDTVFTAGAKGRCFRFDGASWSDASEGLVGHLSALHGTSAQNLYAVGDKGFVARWRGASWDPLALSVRHDFRAVHAMADGAVYLAGEGGVCLVLRDGQMTSFEGTDADLNSIQSFRDKIYLGSAEQGIFVLEEDRLIPFKPKARGYSMDAGPDRLLTCGLSQMAMFDGSSWKARTFG